MINEISLAGYISIFNSSPVAKLIVRTDAPVYTIIEVNDAYLYATNSTRDKLIGKSVFTAFPSNPTDQESKNIELTRNSFAEAIRTKQPHTMSNYRYDIPIPGTDQFEERYWTTTNIPVLDDTGEVDFFIHSPKNVTEIYRLEQREKAGIEALKTQRKQLYSLLMQAPVGIGIFKGPGFVTELINQPLCELYGKSSEELTGKQIFEVLNFAKDLGYEELAGEVMRSGETYRGKDQPITLIRDGVLQTIFVDLVFEPFKDEDGTISGIIAISIDVTQQVTARLRLEEAEERARLAAEAVNMGTFDMNLVNGEMVTSPRFANIFGFSAPVHRDRYLDVFHKSDTRSRLVAHRTAIRKGILFYESRIVWEDGSVHWVRVEGKVFYNNDQMPHRILGTLLDITEEKKIQEQQEQLEKALGASEQLLRKITSASPTCLFMCNENGAITYVNQTWIDWTGIAYEDNMVSGWLDAIYEEDRDKAINDFVETLHNQTLYDVTFRIKHADGAIRWCSACGQPQYREDGSFCGYIGSCTDITEQMELQKQKDAFIGIASHELKTPVTSIKAYTQVLERVLLKKELNIEAGMMRKMNDQLDRLTSLISDLLDVTKINSGKLQFNPQHFEFDLLMKDLVEDLQRTTDRHQLVEHYNTTGTVFADKERLGQVVTNLITNAIKYSPKTDKIIISTELKDGQVKVCVEDFGVGISQDNLGKVFEQFYRVSGNMQHTFPGLGLGLYISAEIIKREGGRIWVESQEGAGSKFCFSIPVDKTGF